MGVAAPLLAAEVVTGGRLLDFFPQVVGASLFAGVFLTLFFHNCILYIATREKDYLLYSLYISALFPFVLSFQGYLALLLPLHVDLSLVAKILTFQASVGFLVLFSLHFLNIKTLSPLLYRIAGLVAFFAILLSFVGFFYFRHYLCALAFFLTLSFSFFLGFFAMTHRSDLATYYLIALGGFIVGVFGAFLGSLGFFDFPQHNLLLIAGSAWQMLIFSMALSRKIRLLSIEHAKAMTQIKTQNKMLFLQSRYTSVGELIRNITHQWKEPLGEIGAIQSNLKSSLILQGSVTKEKLIHAIDLSHQIITHLAQTIDTFYSFFKSQTNEQHEFNAVKTIEDIQKMVNYTFKIEQIELIFKPQESHIFLVGNPNEFSHAVLNLILNAKDILIQRQVVNPVIHVSISQTFNHVLVSVEDNGGGITQTPIESIFNIGTTSHEKNIGLGLFITKTIVEQKMQGTIEAQNIPQGACFTLQFPHQVYEALQKDSHTLFDIEASTIHRISNLEKDIKHHVEVEKNLRHWAQIFEKAHWGIAIYEAHSKTLTLMNPAFRFLYGYDEKELDHQPLALLFSQEWQEKLENIFHIIHRAGQHTFESIHQRKDGMQFPVEVEIIAVKEEEHHSFLYYIVNIRDLTHYKKTHQRLLLKTFALEHIHEAVFLIDEHARFQYVNQEACHSLGFSRKELLRMCVRDIDPDWPSHEWSTLWEELKKKKIITTETMHQRKDGVVFPVEIVSNYMEYGGISFNMAMVRNISERRLLEARKQDEQTKLFFERQLAGMAITSADKRWLKVNDKLCDMLGYTREELLERTWEEVTYPDEYLTEDNVQFERVLHGEIDAYPLKKHFVHKQGHLISVELLIQCVRSQKGEVEYVLAHIQDISERKRAQEALDALNKDLENRIQERTLELQEALAFNEGIINAIPDLLFELDAKGNYLNIWAQNEALLVISKAQLLHKNIADVLPLEASKSMLEALHEARGKGYSFGKTIQLVLEGKQRCFELSISSKTFGDSFIVLSRDITQRRETEIALMKSEEAFRAMVENSPDVIARYDLECRRVYVNPQMRLLLDRPYEAILGKTPDSLSPLPDVTAFKKRFFHAIKTKQECALEVPFSSTIAPKKRWGYIRLIPELDASKTVISVLLIGHDMTEEKRAKEGLELLQAAINHFKEALFIVSNEGIIVFTNTFACEMLGYSQEEVVGRHISEIDTTITPEECLAMAQGPELEKTITFHTQHTTKQGEKLDVEIHGTRFHFNDHHYGISLAKRYTPDTQ